VGAIFRTKPFYDHACHHELSESGKIFCRIHGLQCKHGNGGMKRKCEVVGKEGSTEFEEGSTECSMPGFNAVSREACGQAAWESDQLCFFRARRNLSARPYLHALAAVLATALIAAADAAVPLHEQLVEAGSRAFQTSLSTLWRGSDDLRFKTTYAGGTVLDGFICSDLIDIGGYSSLAPFGCITETSGILDGAGIAGFGGWMCGVHARVMCSSDTVFPHPMPSWCISTSR